MDYNNFERGRSPPQQAPPFVYDDMMRPIPNHREYDNPYRLPPHMFNGPERSYPSGPPHPSDMPPMHPDSHSHVLPPHPFMGNPNHNHYGPSFNDHYYDGHPPSGSYSAPVEYRNPQVYQSHHHGSSAYSNQPRSSSPPYKILCITNISNKLSDAAVKDALTSDFNRFGDVSVRVCHDSGERLAYIYFRTCEDARTARHFRSGTIFFDNKPLEMEPIYEPNRSAGIETADMPSPMLPQSGPPVYSPRRSMSPPNYQPDMTDIVRPRESRPAGQLARGDSPSSPLIYSQHRGPTSPSYRQALPAGYASHEHTPPPLIPPVSYERRNNNEPYSYRSPNMTSPCSPPPPTEQYRSSYRSPSNQSPYSVASPSLTRERVHIPSRSPLREPYHVPELREPPPGSMLHHHHSSSRPSNPGHHVPPPPPPAPRSHSRRRRHRGGEAARLMREREFRRNKFGSDPHPHEYDDSRPSRVLLINNIDATKTETDLREAFEPYGAIEEMEVKKVAPEISSALIKFSSMDGAYKAKTANNGRHIGTLRCRIVYGKVTASRRLWIGGLSPGTTVSSMEDECSRYGDIVSINYTSGRPYCYVEYATANQAQFAAHQLRTTLTSAAERKIRIEFVDPDRADKLGPRHDIDMPPKARTTKDAVYDMDSSPRSNCGAGSRKRSVSPMSDLSLTKRLCPVTTEIPQIAASTFKQERLAAAAAAKARTNSTTSSSTSNPVSDRSDKMRDTNDCGANNNGDSNQPVSCDISALEQAQDVDTRQSIQEAPGQERLSQCLNIKQIVQCCSVSWPGQIALRNFIFPAQIYMCSGQKHNIDKYLSKPDGSNGSPSSPLLRITQRWRLHPQPKLEEVKRRMQTGNLGMLVLTARQETPTPSRQTTAITNNDKAEQQHQAANMHEQNGLPNKSSSTSTPQTPTASEKNDLVTSESGPQNRSTDSGTFNQDGEYRSSSNTSATANDSSSQDRLVTPSTGTSAQSRPLRNLISYLEQKDAAGVVSLSAMDGSDQTPGLSQESPSKLLYAFPPGEFAFNLLKRLAVNLVPDSSKDEYLLGVIVGGNVEGSKL